MKENFTVTTPENNTLNKEKKDLTKKKLFLMPSVSLWLKSECLNNMSLTELPLLKDQCSSENVMH